MSHSHADNAFGLRLVGDLRARLGDDAVWYDASGGLHGGDAWWSTIRRELRERPIFVVILSPDAVASAWVNNEIDLAWKQRGSATGKVIIPVLLAPCAIRDDLDTIDPVSFVPPTNYQAAFAALLDTLRTAPAHPGTVSPRNRRRARHAGRIGAPRGGRLTAGIGSALVVALAISLLITLRPVLGGKTMVPIATQTARAFAATETAQASYTPALGASEAVAYHTNTPGPCDHQALWHSNADANILTYRCQPGGLAVTALGIETSSSSGGYWYTGQGGVFPAKYTVSVDVRNLTPTGCVAMAMDYFAASAPDSTEFDEFYIIACYDGTGSIQYLGGRPDDMLFAGGFGQPGSNFTVAFTVTGSEISLRVGNAPPYSGQFPAPQPTFPLGEVELSMSAATHTTASAMFTNFRFTPLP